MAGKRTRKSKENPNHQFLYSWDQNSLPQARVKRKKDFEAKSDLPVASAKKDIIRSLMIASLVLSLSVVIYLGWKKFMP